MNHPGLIVLVRSSRESNVLARLSLNARRLRKDHQSPIVADLSPVHEARVAANEWKGGFSGSHSDISFGEIYEMICGFFYDAK